VAQSNPADLVVPVLVTLVAGAATTLVAFGLLLRFVKLRRVDAAAVAAHYGSVSAVTFIAARDLAQRSLGDVDGVLVALVVALEMPAILIGLWLGLTQTAGSTLVARDRLWSSIREVLTGRSMLLLGGGLLIGIVAGPERTARVAPLYVNLFDGVLMLFLLELGMTAARRLRDVRQSGWRFVAFALVLPLVHGVAGTLLGGAIGFAPSSAAVFGAMLASASYIAAPAAVRLGLPDANPSLYLTASLGLTFPLNLALGIPLYLTVAQTWLT
jgi:hypothetical protein